MLAMWMPRTTGAVLGFVVAALFWTCLWTAQANVPGCQGAAQQAPATYQPAVWDPGNPASTAPGAKLERAAETVAGAQAALPALQPVAVATGPVGVSVYEGLGAALALALNVIQFLKGRQLKYAIQQVHNDTPSGASALVTDPKAKAIIATVTGE